MRVVLILNIDVYKRQPFTYHDMGTMATVGRNKAVAEIYGLKFQGFPAWFVWMFIHLISILGVKNRLQTFINWAWNYFSYDQSLRLMINTYKEHTIDPVAPSTVSYTHLDVYKRQALHTLVSNRDASATKTTKTGADLLEEIYFNRRIELWGEGHRFFDLKRLNLPVDRRNSNHNSAIALEMLIPAGDVRWEFLIPRDELNANKKAVQNPL